jgi:hypothetical protein
MMGIHGTLCVRISDKGLSSKAPLDEIAKTALSYYQYVFDASLAHHFASIHP